MPGVQWPGMVLRCSTSAGKTMEKRQSRKWFTADEFEELPGKIYQTRTFRKDNAADFMTVQPQFILKQRIE